MGGSNEATCSPPPPPSSAKPVKAAKTASHKPNQAPVTGNSVRYHEVTSRGEIDFHDDSANSGVGLKCSVDSADFFAAYNPWRSKMSEELILAGNDGSGGHASVVIVPYVDDQGEMQVSMTVKKANMGSSVLDLDKLAHYS